MPNFLFGYGVYAVFKGASKKNYLVIVTLMLLKVDFFSGTQKKIF